VLAPARGVAVAAAPDTVHLVRFVLVNPDAKQVALAGDFNGWQSEALTAAPSGGVWSVALPLTSGRYEYAFVVDGERWIADPSLPTARDEFGGEHSVLHVGSQRVM
jgi:1,4-alpha-glucan branching enzyme